MEQTRVKLFFTFFLSFYQSVGGINELQKGVKERKSEEDTAREREM